MSLKCPALWVGHSSGSQLSSEARRISIFLLFVFFNPVHPRRFLEQPHFQLTFRALLIENLGAGLDPLVEHFLGVGNRLIDVFDRRRRNPAVSRIERAQTETAQTSQRI